MARFGIISYAPGRSACSSRGPLRFGCGELFGQLCHNRSPDLLGPFRAGLLAGRDHVDQGELGVELLGRGVVSKGSLRFCREEAEEDQQAVELGVGLPLAALAVRADALVARTAVPGQPLVGLVLAPRRDAEVALQIL